MRDFWGIKKPELAVDSVRLIYRFNPLPAVRQGDTTTTITTTTTTNRRSLIY